MKNPGAASLAKILAITLFLSFMGEAAIAACSETRIKRMSQSGSTVASIAKSCSMSEEDVAFVLKEDNEEDNKLPAGTPVGQCGCWGFVNPGHRQPHPNCRSGYARPSMCPAMCTAGGYMWQGVCM